MSAGTTRLGRLYGVGVGPGASDLLTLRAVDVLRRVPVIAVPKSTRWTPSMAWKIAAPAVGEVPGQERLSFVFPMRKDPALLRPAWARALETLGERLGRGLDVAFMVEGDPMLYSSFVYLLRELTGRHPELQVEIVPGVTSITAAPATARVPLADGQERIAILPATYGVNDLVDVLERFDTVILMKIGGNMPRVVEALERTGLEDKAVFVSRATMADQRIERDLARVRGLHGDCFAMVIVARRERSGVLAGDVAEGVALRALAEGTP